MLVRPAAMERTSCRSGTYVLPQWNVRPADVGRKTYQ